MILTADLSYQKQLHYQWATTTNKNEIKFGNVSILYFYSQIHNYNALCITFHYLGSGCGSVGRAVASDTKGPRFESGHRQTFYYLFTINWIEKTKTKDKRGREGPIFLKTTTDIRDFVFFGPIFIRDYCLEITWNKVKIN